MATTDAPPPGAPPGVPPGPPPDLPHDSLQVNIIVCSVLTWAISALFVALRFYTRARIIKAINWSDWSILISLLFSAATSAGEIEGAVRGAGKHMWDLDPTDVENGTGWGRAAWYALLFYSATLCFSKVSILLLYLHIFAFQWLRRSAQVIMGIVVITSLWNIIATLTACIPLQAYWDMRVPARYCHVQSVWWANLGMLMITDFLIFLLPIPVVWTLKLPKRQKYILLAIFGLGFFVCFLSILRVRYVVDLVNNAQPDFFYTSSVITYWTVVEINAAIVCACLMTMKPLLARIFPRFFNSVPSAPSNPGSDNWVNPPTIGSKPSRDPLRGSGNRRSPRSRDSLDEIHEEDGGSADPFVTDPEKAAALADDSGSLRGVHPADIGVAVSDDSTPSPTSEAGDRGELRPPPRTHLRPPQARHSSGAFYESASDTELPSGSSSGPYFGAGHVRPPPKGNFYDSASDRVDTPS